MATGIVTEVAGRPGGPAFFRELAGGFASGASFLVVVEGRLGGTSCMLLGQLHISNRISHTLDDLFPAICSGRSSSSDIRETLDVPVSFSRLGADDTTAYSNGYFPHSTKYCSEMVP